MPDGWSLEAADFINKVSFQFLLTLCIFKCLARKAASRLGSCGNYEVKNHPWFKGFDWDALNDYKMVAPFIPDRSAENFDQNHVNNQEWKDAEAVKENDVHLKNPSTQQLFKGYFFDKNHHPSQTKSTTGGNETEGLNVNASSKSIGFRGDKGKLNMLPPEGVAK